MQQNYIIEKPSALRKSQLENDIEEKLERERKSWGKPKDDP